jgi:hypothetical protein
MSWAAGRDTLRIEDTAYCLMGLFGVNMPLLYGEGSQAFMRLQLEIMKISDDESLFAWVSKNSRRDRTSGLLANSPAAFESSQQIENTVSQRHQPYFMTNKGLQITLPLYQIEWKEAPFNPSIPPRPPPPQPPPTFVYYLARLNCHFHSTVAKRPVLVTLRATVLQGTETYVRIECNKLQFETPMLLESVTKPVNPNNNKQIFVYQAPQFLPLKWDFFGVKVYTGPLLDRDFNIRIGRSSDLQKVKHERVVYAHEWMFRFGSNYGVQSILADGSSGTLAPNVSLLYSLSAMQSSFSIELLSAEQYKFYLPSSRGPYLKVSDLAPRRDRATLMLPCGDIVSATLKKAPRGGGIIYILDFDYVSAKA